MLASYLKSSSIAPQLLKSARSFHSSPLLALRIGEVAPDFTEETTQGSIQFHKWINNDWALLVSHPADFTPVCTTELASLEKLVPEFKKRGIKPIALSCDRLVKHQKWSHDVLEYGKGQTKELSYPIIADPTRKIARLYDMLPEDPNKDEEGLPLTVRSVFLIDNNKKIRFITVYPYSTGRAWSEVLRVVDSLKLAAKHPIATPENWKSGDDVVVSPSINTEDAKKRYPKINVFKPYLRIIPQPKD